MLILNNIGEHKVVYIQSEGQIIKPLFDTVHSFHKMFKLGYDASFDCWDWAKDLVCRLYTIKRLENWVPKMQTKF